MNTQMTLFPLTEDNSRDALEAAARAATEYPGGFEGRGIIIPAGGPRYFPSAYVNIRVLRELGCRLPIELWYLGSREMDTQMQAIVEPFGVRCVDALRVGKGPCSRSPGPDGGWELKAFSVIRSRFRQVLLLDADNLAVADPTFLFESEPFAQQGTVFWPDYGRFNWVNPIWRLTGIDYRDEPEFESGQLLIDKERCWKPLLLAGWMNENREFWYRFILGDKDTFHLAWRKLGQDYAMPRQPIESLDGVMCQHDFDGRRLFQHHNFHKWSVDSARIEIPGFRHMARCFSYLDELRERWVERPTRRYCEMTAVPAERVAAMQLCEGAWALSRDGAKPRAIRFRTDGSIDEGRSRSEQSWNITHNGFDAIAIISGHEGVAYRLIRSNGLWRGRSHGRSNGMASLERACVGHIGGAEASDQPSRATRPENLRIAIATVPRRPEYIHTTLASLFAAGPEAHRVAGLDLLIGAADEGYLQPYRHHEAIQLHPFTQTELERSAAWSVHRKACLTHYRCLRMPLRNIKGLCVCEDDVVFCDRFVPRLLETVQEMECEFGLQRYVLACYVPYRLNDPALNRGKHFRRYPGPSFHGTQCMYYPKTVVAELADRVWEDGVDIYKQPFDMIVKDYGIEIDAIYATTRSLVQHIGEQTTGLGNFHSSPTFLEVSRVK